MKETACGDGRWRLAFAIARPISSSFIGPELRTVSLRWWLVVATLFLKRWQPVRASSRFGDMGASQVDQALARTRYTTGQIVRARSPFCSDRRGRSLNIPPFKRCCRRRAV